MFFIDAHNICRCCRQMRLHHYSICRYFACRTSDSPYVIPLWTSVATSATLRSFLIIRHRVLMLLIDGAIQNVASYLVFLQKTFYCLKRRIEPSICFTNHSSLEHANSANTFLPLSYHLPLPYCGSTFYPTVF